VRDPESSVRRLVLGYFNGSMPTPSHFYCLTVHFSNGFESSNTPNMLLPEGNNNGNAATPYNKLIKEGDCIIYEHVRDAGKPPAARAFIRAGPRKELHFDPKTVNACIVTCGGLAPGLNSIIHHVKETLENNYAIGGQLWGIRGGYNGFHDSTTPPILLSGGAKGDSGPAGQWQVGLQHQGGSILGSSRGGFDLNKIMEFIQEKDINQVYIVGGDGTHRGILRIAQECLKRKMNVSVAGIPKTIDNDIAIIDRSFGFLTAVEAAQPAIISATTEARCNLPNGIGIVKLMGRSAGFIAAHATLASGDVDLCLVPEVDIVLGGPNGCLPHLERRVAEKGYAVVVVAEGAGEELLGQSTATDASGNKILPPIGQFMKEQIANYFKENGKTATVKYLDPR
jgi:6-phosphofructokinase 1